MDWSSGYEAVSAEFLARRGRSSGRSTAIGVKEVRNWARTLSRGSSVIDLGCGPGFPITVVLIEEGLDVFGVDAAPSFVAAFQRNLPGTPILCEAVQESRFFDRTFDAVLAIGLIFLLKAGRSVSPDPEIRRITSAGRPPAVHRERQTCRLERRNDGIGISLPGGRDV